VITFLITFKIWGWKVPYFQGFEDACEGSTPARSTYENRFKSSNIKDWAIFYLQRFWLPMITFWN